MKTPTQNVRVIGPNLRNEPTTFIVHDSSCAHCSRYEGEDGWKMDASTLIDISDCIWGDMIGEGSMDAEDGLNDITFCPCVKLPLR